jgi:hypothetical protein
VSWVRIDLENGRTAFLPGEELTGTVSWSLDPGEKPAESAEVHLLWFTRGKGTRDADVIATERLEGAPSRSDRRDFRFRLPVGPYSVSGKLVSIVWAVEAVLDPRPRAERVGLTVTTTGAGVHVASDRGGDLGVARHAAGETGAGVLWLPARDNPLAGG